MKLKTVFKNLKANLPKNNPEICGVSANSRNVKRGYLFFAIKGIHTNGEIYINDAVKKGAAAIVSQNSKILKKCKVPTVIVKDIPSVLDVCSHRIYGHPSKQIKTLAITGTDGKTTVSYLIESIYKTADKKSAVIGTINYRLGKKIISKAVNTTPLACDIADMLSYFKSKKADLAILETSAHSLSQKRTGSVLFDAAIFTGLSQDHLDYYKTMDRYFSAKKILFKMLSDASNKKSPKYAILNGDDAKTNQIKKILSNKVKVVEFGLKPKNKWRAENIKSTLNSTAFNLVCPKGKFKVRLKLLGDYNVYNALAALAFADTQNINIKTAVKGVENLRGIAGRMQSVGKVRRFHVIVDFAHTPAAVKKTLTLIKSLRPNKIYTVIGCGGDRDRTKRPIMASAVCKSSDYVFFTADNPRDENQNRIFADMLKGVKGKHKNYKVIADRKKAVEQAIKKARTDDVVLLAGKGHEEGIIIKNKIIPYNDKLTAEKVLRKLKK